MNIFLRAEVQCTDGAGGNATALVLDPATNVATHLVIDPKGHGHDEYLLPLDLVAESSAKRIDVRCSRAELDQLAPFTTMVQVESQGLDTMDAQALMGAESHSGIGFQDFSFAGAGSSEMVEVEAIPESELAVRHGIPVEATDGKAGKVDGFAIDPETRRITHLVLCEGHLFTKKDVEIPVSEIDRLGELTVYLNIPKAAAK
ncbi:MAG TPA: PRC-barrel domain-containing protein [Anaerolineae bacterium]|nr:PRC-barrel domain-containing protein [Anaerolineae bacterium]